MEVLSSYQNGNTQVTIFNDGSLERKFLEPNNIKVDFPSSLDVKITNYCDAGCAFCHEQSTVAGQHGDLNELSRVLAPLPAGVEVAIGGGNPLAHPELTPFLERCKAQGLICNITINQQHVESYKENIINFINNKLIYGIGISYSSSTYLNSIDPILLATNNLVFHLIMGINKINDIETLMSFCKERNKECKVLLLGCKHYGFGIDYYLKNKKIEDNKYEWYTKLAQYFKQSNLVLAFDNLAISQLNLKRYFTESAWGTFYMGDDFQYTMYVDAVNKQYAPSSCSANRVSFNSQSLLEFFKK